MTKVSTLVSQGFAFGVFVFVFVLFCFLSVCLFNQKTLNKALNSVRAVSTDEQCAQLPHNIWWMDFVSFQKTKN